MNNTDTKIFTMFYINEHDNLIKEEKLALMEWVKDADIDQVKYLLKTGEVKDNLTEEDTKLVEVYMTISHPNTYLGAGAAAAAILASVGLAATKAYKAYFSKAAKACKGKAGVEKTNCMNKFKQQAQKAKLQAMQKGLASCSKSKDPSSCKTKLTSKIAKEKAKLGQL